VDGDGDIDLLFANVNFAMPAAARSRLLINDGRGRFADETESRLTGQGGSVFDGVFEDIDRDGDADLLLGTLGRGPQVLRNDGRGRFEALPADALGPHDPQRVGIAIALLRSADGWLLYESGFDRGDRVLKLGG
jgi:hypothetical protein